MQESAAATMLRLNGSRKRSRERSTPVSGTLGASAREISRVPAPSRNTIRRTKAPQAPRVAVAPLVVGNEDRRGFDGQDRIVQALQVELDREIPFRFQGPLRRAPRPRGQTHFAAGLGGALHPGFQDAAAGQPHPSPFAGPATAGLEPVPAVEQGAPRGILAPHRALGRPARGATRAAFFPGCSPGTRAPARSRPRAGPGRSPWVRRGRGRDGPPGPDRTGPSRGARACRRSDGSPAP
jgi:hypothetical protein